MMHEGVGGYFELELPDFGGFLHDDGVLLNSGRNALEYVLRSLPNVSHLWIPYYTCEVILEPIKKLDLSFSFYRIDERLEIRDSIDLRSGDYLLYTNYFGIKDKYVQYLVDRYGTHLIVDNAQAWFEDPMPGVSTVYSPRKFVGIPDGGIAYCPFGIDVEQFELDHSFDRCSHLLKRIDLGPSAGYRDFRENSEALINQPIQRMSRLTERLLRAIDYEAIKQKRRKNFLCLDERLKKDNLLSFLDFSSFGSPMVYPFLTKDNSLKERLIKNKIFVATYWPSVLNGEISSEWEFRLAQDLVCLPVDQRYGEQEMAEIVNLIVN